MLIPPCQDLWSRTVALPQDPAAQCPPRVLDVRAWSWVGHWSLIVGHLVLLSAIAFAADRAPDGSEFFEKRVRPVLVERCYKCHSASAEKLKAQFHLDSREGLLQGGESGKPAIAPGEPENSRLIEAVRYANPDLQMPPKNRLAEAQIADLVAWVKMGAPWPKEPAVVVERAAPPAFDLWERKRRHWCWQPIQAVV